MSYEQNSKMFTVLQFTINGIIRIAISKQNNLGTTDSQNLAIEHSNKIIFLL